MCICAMFCRNPMLWFFPSQPGRILQARRNLQAQTSALAVGRGLEPSKIRFPNSRMPIPNRGNLFLPVRLLVWADGQGTVGQADSAARAELQEAPKHPKQKLLQLKNIQKYYWVKHKEMLICCLNVSPEAVFFVENQQS
jgi:hypothetical protein